MTALRRSKENDAPTARQRILETALRLFYAEGVRGVGIDRIIAESSVAKMSFYRHFPSKTDLVCAFLEERHRRWNAWLDASLERHAKRRRSSLVAVADALADWFAEPGYRGCAFINAAAELGEHSQREHGIARAHKQELLERLTALAARDRLSNPDEVGRRALLIVEGAIVRAQMTGSAEPAADARNLLAALVATHSRRRRD